MHRIKYNFLKKNIRLDRESAVGIFLQMRPHTRSEVQRLLDETQKYSPMV